VSLVGGRSGLGDAIGQVYVQRYFPAESKAMMEELVENLREALRQRITGLDWMTEETKEYAFEKLAAFTPNIGYPNKWRDFSDVTIEGESVMNNVRQLRALQREIAIDRLDHPTDREEWFMTPQTVNAYYVPQFNSIFLILPRIRP
jgi:putative endopeptidase